MTVLPALKKQFLMRCLIASFNEFLEKEIEDFGLFLDQCFNRVWEWQCIYSYQHQKQTSESSLISLS